MSHDLRAPLRSIRGFSEVLLERYAAKLDERGQEFLRRTCESSQVMDRLIEDLLKLSRVTRAEIQRRPVNLSLLAESIASDLRNAEPSRSGRRAGCWAASADAATSATSARNEEVIDELGIVGSPTRMTKFVPS